MGRPGSLGCHSGFLQSLSSGGWAGEWGELYVLGEFEVHGHVPPIWHWGHRHTWAPLRADLSPCHPGPFMLALSQGAVSTCPAQEQP